MSAIEGTTGAASSGAGGKLPDGVTVGPGRETSQLNSAGQVVQGMLFPVTLPNLSTTSVFVPYSILGNPDQVLALFTNRIQAILAIPGQG